MVAAMSSDDNKLSVFSEMNIEKIFSGELEEFSDEQAATAWAMIDLLEKVIEDRKKELREALFSRAEKSGKAKENGSLESSMGSVTVVKERRQGRLPDEEVVKACLKEAGLEYEDAFSAQMKWVMDPSKVDFLVQCGKLPAEKIEASKSVTYALKVKPNKEIKEKLEEAKKRLTGG